MQPHRKSILMFWVYRSIVLGCTSIVIFLLLLSLFNINRTFELERLEGVADLSRGIIAEQLQGTGSGEAHRKLTLFAEKYGLDGIELYRSDGSIVTAYGKEESNSVNSSNALSESFVVGDDFSYRWPLSFRFQYSKIFVHGARPLGFLILYSSLGENVAVWLVSCAASVILLILLLLSLLFSKRSQYFVKTHGQPVCGKGGTDFRGEQLAEAGDVRELRRERDSAVASARAKGDFLASMSHEIRTSLNGVIGVLSLLQKSDLKGEQGRLLETAARSADSVLLIINDILDFSKIEAGKIIFEKIEFDLRRVVEDSVELYADSAFAKNIGLHCYIATDIATRLQGDPNRLRQILTNLLSNAVKFTDEGEVTLGITIVEGGDERQQLMFTIEDTGIGIAADKLDYIFDTFIQADSSTTRMYGGSGLGLSVCKQLVELQNGEVGVKSRLGLGTSFWFTLGFDHAASVEDVDVLQKRHENAKIALFDSCETSCTIISQYLKGLAVKSSSCDNLETVVQELKNMAADDFHPDKIVVDAANLGVGIDQLNNSICKIFPEKTPGLYLLSHGNGADGAGGLKNVSGIIFKPVRLHQLHDELFTNKMITEGQADGSQGEEELEKLEGKVLLVDDERINQHVGKMILEKLGLQVDIARSGSQAVLKTEAEDYNLVLMDIQMPGMSGIEAVEKIRARESSEKGKRLSIIAVTANAITSIREKCLDVGMDDFIAKPIKAEVLHQSLQPWLSRKKTIQNSPGIPDVGTPANEDTGETAGSSLVVWDKQLALEYVGGDESLLMDLMRLFLKRKEILLGSIEDATAVMDGQEVSNAAHAFKGAVNHFAAKRCSQLAQDLENKAGDGWFDGIEEMVEELRLAADNLESELERQI